MEVGCLRAGLDGCRKSHPPPPTGMYPRTVHDVTSGYTDYEFLPQQHFHRFLKLHQLMVSKIVGHGTSQQAVPNYQWLQ
jgi:hypothetical protein